MTQKELSYLEDIHKVECLVNDVINSYLDCDLSDKSLDLLKSHAKEHEHNMDDIVKLLGEM